MPLHRCRANKRQNRFFHPDYTVGTGVSPVRPFGSRTCSFSLITAGGESHPALKQIYIGYYRVSQASMSRTKSESMDLKKAAEENVSKKNNFVNLRYMFADPKHGSAGKRLHLKRRGDITNDFLSTNQPNKE